MRFIAIWIIILLVASFVYAGILHPYKLPKRVLVDDVPCITFDDDPYLKQTKFSGVERKNISFIATEKCERQKGE